MPETQRAWRIVLERVESDLLGGVLGPGDRLPSERELAADLGVGRSSVREALRVLEVMGLIRTATGSGPQSGAIVIAAPSGGMSALMRLQVAAQGFPLADVVQTRLVLEDATVAALAAMRYLWSTPHRLDNTRLRAVIGEEPHTPFDQAVRQALADLLASSMPRAALA